MYGGHFQISPRMLPRVWNNGATDTWILEREQIYTMKSVITRKDLRLFMKTPNPNLVTSVQLQGGTARQGLYTEELKPSQSRCTLARQRPWGGHLCKGWTEALPLKMNTWPIWQVYLWRHLMPLNLDISLIALILRCVSSIVCCSIKNLDSQVAPPSGWNTLLANKSIQLTGNCFSLERNKLTLSLYTSVPFAFGLQ